jgi:hypothetical protein
MEILMEITKEEMARSSWEEPQKTSAKNFLKTSIYKGWEKLLI